MTATTQNVGVKDHGAERSAITPVLAHRMKHDKSILALAVSAEYIFAGTQGGEILVSAASLRVMVEAEQGRSTASTHTSAGASSARTKAACWGFVCRRTRRCCSRVRRTPLSMYVVYEYLETAS
jgi:hypothetical protein